MTNEERDIQRKLRVLRHAEKIELEHDEIRRLMAGGAEMRDLKQEIADI